MPYGPPIGFGALVVSRGPSGRGRSQVTFLPFVYRDLLVGNIHLMLAATVVVGLRHSAVWALPLLTKITPGVGLLWFARQTTNGASLFLAIADHRGHLRWLHSRLPPHLWFEWFARLRSGYSRPLGGSLA